MKVQKLRPQAQLPRRSTEGAAGYDLCACIDEPMVLKAGEILPIPTGIAIQLPNAQTVALVFGRSGLGFKYGIAPANAVGVIDSDYRGEISVALHNAGKNEPKRR